MNIENIRKLAEAAKKHKIRFGSLTPDAHVRFFTVMNPQTTLELLGEIEMLKKKLRYGKELVDVAINAGDWNVDGACDPSSWLYDVDVELLK